MTPRAFDLTGRVALVTGAGSATGIGFATARLLAELGAVVQVSGTTERVFDRAAELADEGFPARGLVADLTRAEEAQRLVREATAHQGHLDIVVNNAGMTSITQSADGESGDALQLDESAWSAALRRNLDTAYFVSRAAVGGMRDQSWGRIVNVASVTGPVMAMRSEVGYAAAKAGMVGLTRSMAIDFAPHGVTINAVAPGWIATGSQTEHERVQGLHTPLGRSATPDEVASAIAWLCTPGASYVTGQVIVVDGANSIAEERA